MKILIIQTGTIVSSIGGVGHVLINMANAMAQKGHEVVLAYCTEQDGPFYYPVDNRVRTVNIISFVPGRRFESVKKTWKYKIHRELLKIKGRSAMKNLKARFEMQKIGTAIQMLVQQEHADIIISPAPITTAAVHYIADPEHRCPLIAMCHADGQSLLDWTSDLEKKAMSACDAVQVLMPEDVRVIRDAGMHWKLVCIPNVVPQYGKDVMEKTMKEPLIIDVGRLDNGQKRQYLLVEAFAEIAKEFPEWSVELWGKDQDGGKQKKALEKVIQKCGMQGRVKLCGATKDVVSVYRRASVFAFPSAYEGFPLAMTEAMSAGLPVVAYQSCQAVNRLVKDRISGFLVQDGVLPFSEGLKRLLEDRDLRIEMGGAAHNAMKTFAADSI